MTDALFIPDGDRFVPTKQAGSPWADAQVHGGPPAGLLARAVEGFVTDADLRVVRLTIDLFRPVPMAPLAVAARAVRAGRRIQAIEASLLADRTEVCRASGLLLRASEAGAVGAFPLPSPPPGPEGIETASLAGPRRPDRPIREGFHTAIEARWVRRDPAAGAVAVWLRMPLPLVAGEEPSPLVRLAALADFVNPISGTGASGLPGFINTDSTIYVHRLPMAEWIGLVVQRATEPYGIAVADATLFDAKGAVGRATQALLANRMR